jgi:hypothetical protein
MARRPGPATAIALRIPCAMSYVSTSRVVFLPSVATWDANAAGSSSCSSVKACAEVPAVGMPYRPPAARLEVEAKPARYAARAAATAASSWVRREPISMIGRPRAAVTIRAAAAATALSWLSTDRISVSSTTHSPKPPDTVRIGEPGKNSSPSAYPSMSPVKW